MKQKKFHPEDWDDLQVNILENITNSVIVTDLEGRVIYWNQGAEKVFGYTKKEMLGKPPTILYPESSQETFQEEITKIKEGETYEGVWEGRTKQGEKVYISVNTNLYYDRSGEVKGIIGVGSEVTELMQIQKEKSELLHELGERVKELRSSQEGYKKLFEVSPMPKVLFEPNDLKILKVNQKMVELYGYSEEELVGNRITDFRYTKTEEEIQDTVRQMRQDDSSPVHSQHTVKSGEVIDVEIHATNISHEGKECVLAVIRDITELKKLQKQVEKEKVERQQEVSKAIIQAQESERQEIGRELHDNVNQLLAAASINLDAEKNNRGEETSFLENSIKYLNKSIYELREISHRMLHHENQTLKEYIESALKSIDPEHSKKLFLTYENMEEVSMGEALKINLYRIVQEQLKNVMMYSKAEKIEVNVHYTGENILLEVKDNGVGFDPDRVAYGIGIKNMRDRAELYGGEFRLYSKEGEGTSIMVQIPVEKESEEKGPIASEPT